MHFFNKLIKGSTSNGQFPTELKIVDVIPIVKKDSPFDKTIGLLSRLPSLPQVNKKIVHKQLNSFFETKQSPLLLWFSVQGMVRSGHF